MEATPLVVVGAGVSGTAAAIEAASVGVQVTLVDENPVPTSLMGLDIPQFFGRRFTDSLNSEAGTTRSAAHTKVALAEAEAAGVDIQLGTCVWGAFRNSENSRVLDGPQIGLSDYQRSWMIKYERLIVATGSRDLSIGFGGWELPGVMGANGAYSLMKRYDALSSKRIVVLGSGNLGLNTAMLALENGTDVAAVVDVSPGVQGDPALATVLNDRGAELYTSHAVCAMNGGDGELKSVDLVEIDDNSQSVAGTEKVISADTVCLAIGLVPNIELISLLGCELAFESDRGGHVPNHDDWMRTSVENVFVAGDVAGFHDAMILRPEIARDQGRLAGIAAAASLGAIDDAEANARRSEIQINDETTSPIPEHNIWENWLKATGNTGGLDVLACPCEEVTRADVLDLQPPRYLGWESEPMSRRNLQTQLNDNPVNPNQIKRLTRAGTGVCQGRRCREQVAMLLSEASDIDVSEVPLMTYRAPVRPLPLNVMWPDDEPQQVRDEWPKWFSPTSRVLG